MTTKIDPIQNEIKHRQYKGYTILNIGISQYIYRPGRNVKEELKNLSLNSPPSDGYQQSMAAAKRWINADLAEQNESAYRA